MKNKKVCWVLAAALSAAVLCSMATPALAKKKVYSSELTGESISTELKKQRPIAVMVDNESISLPHYGTADADVVYELMNSTANERVSRLMVLVKDWGSIARLGNIRSTRTSNIPLAAEWNAILVHDGGPFYVNEYFAKDYAKEHFSGGFSRIDNGKPTEFTEYVVKGDLERMFASSGFSTDYNEYRNSDKTHFQFAAEDEVVSLPQIYGQGARAVTEVTLPFYHNKSTLKYNEKTGTYDYYEYGEIHKDGEDERVLTFKNVLIQDVGFTELDGNGYMEYDLIEEKAPAYYLTEGYAIPIVWSKTSETDHTRYFDGAGNEVTLNVGKTYVGLVPADTWTEVTLQ